MGAAAREMLVAAAAHRLDVPPDTLALEHSAIRHKDSGRSVGLGEIAAEAAQLPPPKEPRLKAPRELALVGRALPRWDIPAKVDGSAVFGIDVAVPNFQERRIGDWRRSPWPGKACLPPLCVARSSTPSTARWPPRVSPSFSAASRVSWAWAPERDRHGRERARPPVAHDAFVDLAAQWVAAGAPCPE